MHCARNRDTNGIEREALVLAAPRQNINSNRGPHRPSPEPVHSADTSKMDYCAYRPEFECETYNGRMVTDVPSIQLRITSGTLAHHGSVG